MLESAAEEEEAPMTERELDALVADVAKRCDRDLTIASADDGGYMPVSGVSIPIISGYIRHALKRCAEHAKIEETERATMRKAKRERRKMVRR